MNLLLTKDKDLAIASLLFFAAFTVYFITSKGDGAVYNYFVLLSDAFLHGRLNIINPPSWLNELVSWNGIYYTVFPPMPAIFLLPFVAVFGTGFYQPFISCLFGALNVGLSFLVFRKLFNQKVAFWTSFLYGFGTIQWFHASVGSAWYLAHMVSQFFLWMFIIEFFTKRRFFLLGLFLGGAYLSRLPTIFAVFFVIAYYYNFKTEWKKLMLVGLGIVPALLLNALYNYFRYGVFL